MSEPKVLFATDECVICLEKPPCQIILPCRHICVCEDCAKSVLGLKMGCPLDRGEISEITLWVPDVVEPAPILELDVVEFKQKRRQDYVRVARNAGYLGAVPKQRPLAATYATSWSSANARPKEEIVAWENKRQLKKRTADFTCPTRSVAKPFGRTTKPSRRFLWSTPTRRTWSSLLSIQSTTGHVFTIKRS